MIYRKISVERFLAEIFTPTVVESNKIEIQNLRLSIFIFGAIEFASFVSQIYLAWSKNYTVFFAAVIICIMAEIFRMTAIKSIRLIQRTEIEFLKILVDIWALAMEKNLELDDYYRILNDYKYTNYQSYGSPDEYNL